MSHTYRVIEGRPWRGEPGKVHVKDPFVGLDPLDQATAMCGVKGYAKNGRRKDITCQKCLRYLPPRGGEGLTTGVAREGTT